MRNTRRIAGLVLLILLASTIQWPQGQAITPQDQTISITNTHDDMFITETGIGIDSQLCHITDPNMDIRSFLAFRELEINFWEPLKNATLRFRTTTTLDFDADSSVTVYGMRYSDLQREGWLNPSWVLTVPFTSAYTNYNTSQFYGQTWHEVDVTDIVEELIRSYDWDGDGHAGTETGDAIGFIIVGAEGHDTRWFIDYLYGTPSLAPQLVIHWNHEPPPPAEPPEGPDPVFVEQYGNYTIWVVNRTLDLTGWEYRKEIIINGSTAGEQTDYQVHFNVSYGNGTDGGDKIYLDSKSKSDFSDIRFTESDKTTLLDHWIKGPTGAIGEKIVDGDGIGGKATHEIIRPQAIYYEGINKRTYIIYCDDGYDPKILYYDHTSDTFSSPVLIGLSPINDDHGSPALLIDENGYLHAFYGSHNSNLKHSKSDNPEDISAWTGQADPVTLSTYPIARLASNGDIYLFYRRQISGTHKPESFVVSIDDGANWGAVTTPIDFGDGYWIYHGQFILDSDDSLHITWSYYAPATTKRENTYYAYSIDGGSSWKAKDGTDLGATIIKAEADANCLVYDSTGNPAIPYNGFSVTGHVMDLQLDSSNEPYIVFLHGKEDNECQYKFAKWTVGAWNLDNITTTGYTHNWVALDYVSSTDIKVYNIVGGYPGPAIGWKGNLELWNSIDNGETWNNEQTIAFEDGLESRNPRLVQNYNDDLQIVWTAGFSTPSDVYAYGDAMTPDLYSSVWVEMDTIPIHPNNGTTYLYYGKSDATSTSNILTTMIRGDDGVIGNFTEDVAGTAAFSYVDRKYNIAMNSDDDASASGDILPSWQRAIHMDSIPFLGSGVGGAGTYEFGLFDEDDVTELIGVNAVANPKGRFRIKRYASNGGFANEIIVWYLDLGSVDQHWDGDSWEPGVTRHAAPGTLEFRIWSNGTKFYADVLSDGSSIFTATPSIAIASVKSFVDGESIVWGEIFTDFYWCLANVDNYFIRKYVSPEPALIEFGEEEAEGDDEYFVADMNGTVLVDDLDSLDDAEDWIDTYDPDPLDPDPPGWPETGGFTRFRMRLYFLVLGLGCLFGPILFFATGRGTGYYLMCGFIIMLIGIGLLMSIGDI